MGKDSLLESTSKKKTKAAAKKSKAAKKGPATKSAPDQKAPSSAAAKPSKPAAAASPPAKVKPPTRRELLSRKFDLAAPPTTYRPPSPAPRDYTAPSFFAGLSASAAAHARGLLHKRFDWKEIQAAGEAYAAELEALEKARREEEARRKAAEEAKRKAEEEARRKAAEEAQRKAEDDARRKAAEEAQRKAEEDARRKAAEEAQRKAAEEAQRKANEAAKRKAAEEAQRKTEEEARRQAAEEAQQAAQAAACAGQGRLVKLGALGLLAIFALLIASSHANTRNFYIAAEDGAVEIRRGIFAPMGTTRLILMPGQVMPAEPKEVYTWQDAFALIHQFYIDRADALLEVPGVPDTAGVLASLEKALHYAPDKPSHAAALGRLASMRMQILLQKAEAALNRGSSDDARAALEYLREARDLRLSPAEVALVDHQLAAAEQSLADRRRAEAEAAALAAEKQALEEAAGVEAAAGK